MEDLEDQPCTTLDPSGNLRLQTDTQDFIVSSKVMCLASPVWRAKLDPQGPWARQAPDTYSFSEDDPNALLILLQIAHLQFSELPDVLVVFEHLLQLAVLCDKYDTVQLVRPWISKWQAPLQAQAEESGYHGYEAWLFIAWTFGDEVIFNKISRSLVLTSTVTTVNAEPRLTNALGDLVSDTVPPGSTEAIIEARSGRIFNLLEMCYKLVDQYESTTANVCTRSQSCEECDSLVYGCLIKGLRSLNLSPKRAEVSEVEASVMVFADKLRSLRCFVLPSGHSYDYDYNGHGNCGFIRIFARQIDSIIDRKEPSGVLEAHLEHINEQRGNKM